jgi:energy-coupling factor transporter ATP-binding protein EcfA2
MTNNAHAMYALGLNQIANMIKVNGHKRTVLVQGHMGTGKSSLLKLLAADMPNHKPVYFDCTTKDLGDIMLPRIAEVESGSPYVSYAPNEELGVHHKTPVIVMLDEYGKANPAVKQGLTAFMLERRLGSYELHPESIVFATTNLGSEGVGDLLVGHQRNRITTVIARKPGHMEWIEWGINNGIDHSLLGWVKDNPQLMHSFEDVKNPEDNPYIYHPRAQQVAFVTPRSLEAASDWLKQREYMDQQSVTAALMGTIGDRAAMDLMAFVALADDLPTLESIKKDPENARLPISAAAVCMVVYRTLASIEAEWIDSWMTYMLRLDKEAQALFANGVRAPRYHKQGLVMTNRKFTEWAMKNNYLFSADKK